MLILFLKPIFISVTKQANNSQSYL